MAPSGRSESVASAMSNTTMAPAVRALLIVSLLSVPVTFTHSVEDFAVGIHQRFGLPLLLAAFLLSLGYVAQFVAGLASAREQRWGYGLNLLLALVWFFGAVADHLGEVLTTPTGQYRAGAISKALAVGIMLVALAWAGLAARALRQTS